MDLVLLVCLISSPQDCREERVAVSYQTTDSRACMMAAVPIIAEWSGGHPEYQVNRWKCGDSGSSRLTRNFN
ncbi:hypothetical protein [Methylopila sp. M107]|uniref:hypothetical protein n=1 Tax=Methylopila sp. M107 TaxID=1101190 RepID=UPI0003802E16|nr:hypothetical protein [Methylopila sp. M107]